MYPYARQRDARDDTVAEIDGYPIDARMHRQMIERAKARGCSYSDVEHEIRSIVERYGADDVRTDAEIEILLDSHQAVQHTLPPRKAKGKRQRISSVERMTR
jgi:hypothetical protein